MFASKQTTTARGITTGMVSAFFIAYCKKTVSTSVTWMDKFRAQMLADTEVAIHGDLFGMVKALQGVVVPYDTKNGSLREIFERFNAFLPERCLRLKLLVEQAQGTGLSQLNLIQDALLQFPDFCWFRLESLFPGELASVQSALAAYNEDPYMGLRPSNPIPATKYKGFAYASKQLLIKIAGVRTLEALRTFGNMTNTAAVDALIVKFEEKKREQFAAQYDGEGVSNQPERIAEIIRLARNERND